MLGGEIQHFNHNVIKNQSGAGEIFGRKAFLYEVVFSYRPQELLGTFLSISADVKPSAADVRDHE